VIGSIVGIHKYVYDIFGPAVNLASRLEHLSDPMEITLCEDMYPLIKADFQFDDLGEADIKGVGTKRIYRLVAEGRAATGRSGWKDALKASDRG
jgi:adenylate cyclase